MIDRWEVVFSEQRSNNSVNVNTAREAENQVPLSMIFYSLSAKTQTMNS